MASGGRSSGSSSSNSSISRLAAVIQTNTGVVDQYLEAHHLPSPSFAAGAPVTEENSFPPHVAAARLAVIDATLELRDLLLGPKEVLINMVCSKKVDAEAIHRLAVAQHVPREGIAYAELARQLGVSDRALTQLLRAAIAHRVFVESRPGYVAHSAASQMLAQDRSLQDWMGAVVLDISPSLNCISRALQTCPAADEPAASGASFFLREENGGKLETFYNTIDREPERARRFAAVMSHFQQGDGYGVHHVVEGYDWAALSRGAVVVDVGGSHGDTSVAIAERHPHLQFVVQDLPATIASAPPLPQSVSARIRLEAHDMLQPQPVHGAAVYLLRWVLHNWPDKYVLLILRALRPALVRGSKVLIVDAVMPPFGSWPNTVERDLRWMDLTMLALFNAGDREAEHWESVVQEADRRFQFQGVKRIRGSTLSVMELVWGGGND